MYKLLYLMIAIVSFCITFFNDEKERIDYANVDYEYENDTTASPVILNRDSILRNVVYNPYIKEKGLINDPQTALAVGLIIAQNVYGERVLEQTPYGVCQDGDLWIISGSTPFKYRNYCYRGCFHIVLNKYNGEIYNLWVD